MKKKIKITNSNASEKKKKTKTTKEEQNPKRTKTTNSGRTPRWFILSENNEKSFGVPQVVLLLL